MAQITILAGTAATKAGDAVSCKMRIYNKYAFVTSDDESVFGSRIKSDDFYKEIPCSVAGGVVSYPSFQIDSTVGALADPKGTTYSIALYSDDGEYLGTLFKDLIVDESPTGQTIGGIVAFTNENTPNPTPVDDYYTKVQTNALIEAAVSSATEANTLYALRFDAAKKSKLYAGQMYKHNVNLDTGYIEYIYKARAGGQYVISVDDGGAHVWLLGHLVDVNGKSVMAGNMSFYDTDGAGAQHNVTVNGSDYVFAETWHHYAAAYDYANQRFTPFVDGVAGKDIIIPAGYRRRIGDLGWGECHLGGSHHLTATGDMIAMAIYEGLLPFSNGQRPATFRPSRLFGYATQDASGNHRSPNMFWPMNYPTGRVVPDLGSGYNGAKHNAVFHADVMSQGSYSGVYGDLIHATGFPEWVKVTDFAKPSYQGAAHVNTPNAIVSDSFSRSNVTPFWDDVIGLGTAPTGQVWEGTTGIFGIMDECAYVGLYGQQIQARIASGLSPTGGYVNMRAEATRKSGAGCDLGVHIRYTDASNYIFAVTNNEYNRAFLYEVVSGVPNMLQEISSIGGSWNKIGLEGFGSAIRVYIDNVLVHTETGVTNNPTGNRGGLYGEGFMRYERFDLFAATS